MVCVIMEVEFHYLLTNMFGCSCEKSRSQWREGGHYDVQMCVGMCFVTANMHMCARSRTVLVLIVSL